MSESNKGNVYYGYVRRYSRGQDINIQQRKVVLSGFMNQTHVAAVVLLTTDAKTNDEAIAALEDNVDAKITNTDELAFAIGEYLKYGGRCGENCVEIDLDDEVVIAGKDKTDVREAFKESLYEDMMNIAVTKEAEW